MSRNFTNQTLIEMRLTIPTTDLEAALKAVFLRRPSKKAMLSLTAIDGMLILESDNNAGAARVPVEQSGQVILPAKTFRDVLDTYKGVPELRVEADAGGLRINAFKISVSSWNPSPTRPAGF
jgi:DNA polymerase III sliding clamp (beta) subunit (PCNA family)